MNLRQRVLKRIYGFSMDNISIGRIIDIVRKSTHIVDEKGLIEGLRQYFVPEQPMEPYPVLQHDNDLADFVLPNNILIKEDVTNWKEAIKIAAAFFYLIIM